MNCPLCHRPFDQRVLQQASSLQPNIQTLLRQSLPNWQVHDGLCPDCALSLAQKFAAQRQTHSLHTNHDPHSTFPYYHVAEESVLGLTERLADYYTFPARGVTVAFLDSGYYPHPDLGYALGSPIGQQQEQGRLINYVDLTDGGERTGLAQPSLWHGEGYSWHGQMTSVIACGDGALSAGRYRGFAPAASLLPIKIGRTNGRIPEEDILGGLNWLLKDDNWARYNVRVVNISVGGDFVQPWDENPVCLAAEKLSERGVLVAAAAGNSGRNALLAPAQAPSVVTVGGYDDHNRHWNPASHADVRHLAIYHHNWAGTRANGKLISKPELLALGRYVPGPILPVSPVWHEMETIAALRRVLGMGGEGADAPRLKESELVHVDRAVRRAMNAHKWIHPHYQHVDGTSVSVAQVSAVAAQMAEANPKLSTDAMREILFNSALPLPVSTSGHTGYGILQPAMAVAEALRTGEGILRHYPRSATPVKKSELQKWQNLGKVEATGSQTRYFYLGLLAPHASSVSLLAPFNNWSPGKDALQRAENGWWHTLLAITAGDSIPYCFWVEDEAQPGGHWQPDPENPARCESGYGLQHSLMGG